MRTFHSVLSALAWFGFACGTPIFGQASTRTALPHLTADRPPNVVLILADDLGYGDLGAYGQTKIQTPHLDMLAAQGARLTQAYAGSSQGAASRCALFTGFHTGHARIRGDREVPLRTNDLTVAKVLQQAGYATCLVGEWGLGREQTTGTPHQHGFQEWLGFLTLEHGQEKYPTFLWRSSTFNQVFDHILPLDANAQGRQQIYAADYLTMAATNFVRGHRFVPFFLAVSYNLPRANLRLDGESGGGLEIPTDAPYSRQDWTSARKQRAAMITRMDRLIGQLLQSLDRFQLQTNTLVLVTSDNGPAAEAGGDPEFFVSAGPFRGGKGDLAEGGLRVPFLAKWPARIPPGQVRDEPFAFWDLLPTLAEAARVPAPPGLDGLSLLPDWTGQSQTNRHDYLYWETHGASFRQAARLDDWKAIREGFMGSIQLFDLSKDPKEEVDLAGDHPDIVRRMRDIFENARTESEDWPVAKP